MEHEQEERMNIYRFIDSRDMRKHLQKLNYAFTAPEAAFLVYWYKDATLEERIAAWRDHRHHAELRYGGAAESGGHSGFPPVSAGLY